MKPMTNSPLNAAAQASSKGKIVRICLGSKEIDVTQNRLWQVKLQPTQKAARATRSPEVFQTPDMNSAAAIAMGPSPQAR